MNKLSKMGSDAEVLQAIVDQHRDGFMVADADLHLVFANTRAYELFKIDTDKGDDVIHLEFDQIMTGFRDLVQKAENVGHGVADVRRIKIMGQATYVEAYVNPIRLSSGAGIVSFTCRDTSEEVNWRHMMRTSLQQNTEMVRAIAETVPVGLSVTDSKGRFVAVNNKLCDLLGYQAQDLINQTFTMMVPEDGREAAAKAYQWFLAGAGDSPETEDLQTQSGEIKTVGVSASTFMGRNGRPYKVTCYDTEHH